MDILIKQTRARFGSTRQVDKQEGSNMQGDKRILPQSLREKRRSHGWIRRQSSRRMSWDYDNSGSHYPTAAAAYAVKSLEELGAEDRKVESYAPDKSLNKMKRKVEVPGIRPERPKTSAKVTGKSQFMSKNSQKDPQTMFMNASDEFSKASFKDQHIKVPKSNSTGKTKPDTGINVTPSMKKKASFADIDQKDERTSNKSKNSVAETPPTFAFKNLNITAGSAKAEIPAPTPAAKPGPRGSMADAWEKEEMTSVRERYEKMMDTIEKWETKKITNATSKVKRREVEMDKKRMKTLQSYRTDITRIQEVAEAARAQAEKNRRNEEIKVKEKANKIRLTGKIPATCLCF